MPSKRKYKDLEPTAGVHESRRIQVYGDKPKPAKKTRRTDSSHKQQTSAVNDIKKHIRDLRRRLARVSDLPADIRADDERALAAYEHELAAAEVKKIRDQSIRKWHMVRFFERQKATRRMKKVKKQLLAAETDDDVQRLKRELHVAEVDLNYTQFCPLAEPYISLYARKEQITADEDEDEGREGNGEAEEDEEDKIDADSPGKPPMWVEVERRMEDGTLDKLRNRDPPIAPKPQRSLEKRPAPAKSAPKATSTSKSAPAVQLPPLIDMTGLNRRERRRLMRGEESEPRTRTKIKSMSAGFEKNQAFGAAQAARTQNLNNDEESDDGGFFE